MTDITIPDLSEFQGIVDWRALVAAAYPVAIIRAHNGNRADHFWSANRSGAHAAGIKALGIYQYVVAGRDAATQANELCDLIGTLKPGEWPICDLEEGTGDQSARAHAWYSTVAARLHNAAAEELYTGDYFYGAHHLSAAGFKRIWLASYGTAEPSSAHELWQFTDARHFPGIAGTNDASVFHGTVEQLLAHINPTPTPPEDVVTPQDKTDIINGVVAKLESGSTGGQFDRDRLADSTVYWLRRALDPSIPLPKGANLPSVVGEVAALRATLAAERAAAAAQIAALEKAVAALTPAAPAK